MKSNRILLIGYHGAGNLGDELILKQFLEENNIDRFYIISYGKVYNYSNVIDTLHWKKGNKILNFILFLSVLLKVEKVYWIGGTCFTDQDGDGGFKFMLLTKLIGKSIHYVNIGINNLHVFKRLLKTRIILSLADSVTVRDLNSYDLAIKYSFSPLKYKKISSSLETDLGEKHLNKFLGIVSNENTLLIAWRTLDKYFHNHKKITLDLIKFINDVASFYSKVVVINTDDYKDLPVSNYIYNKLSHLNNIIYIPNLSTNTKINYMLSSNMIITSRLHVGIAGSLFKKNTFVFNYSDKINYYVMNNSSTFKIFNQINQLYS